MSLRTQHDLAELRRSQQARATQPLGSRLSAVLRAGLEAMRATPAPAPVGDAPRGARLPYGQAEWERSRLFRLTASMLPFWVEMQGPNRGRVARKEIVRVMAQHGGAWKYDGANPFVKELMAWGRDHEVDGVMGYMELTRHLVGLGSTRLRDEPAPSKGEHTMEGDGNRRWEWHEVMSATPDGFLVDEDDRFVGSLLEVKCPAALKPEVRRADDSLVPRRYAPELRLRFENDPYLHLQAWMQLAVCTEAEHVYLVYWKQAAPSAVANAPPPDQYVWLARLSRNDTLMDGVRQALGPEVDAFHHAMMWIQNMPGEDGDDSDVTVGEPDDEPMLAEDTTARRERWAANGLSWSWKPDDAGDRIVMTGDQKVKLKEALRAWVHRELRWRDGGSAPDFPWTSMWELERRAGYAQDPNPTSRLCHRYHVQSGAAATHGFDATGTSGSAELGYVDLAHPVRGGKPLRAAHLWPKERIGFYHS